MAAPRWIGFRTMIVNANALHIPIADKSVQCVVTSPPYYLLRDYGVYGQIGLEQTPDEYIANMVAVFREVWRVLRDDGTLWLNVGDSYAGGTRGGNSDFITGKWKDKSIIDRGKRTLPRWGGGNVPATAGLKTKDLIGIPWRLAFALQSDGWYLRSDIIWAKPNPMPESVTDRPTKSHEYLFLLTKSPCYYYDADAIKEGVTGNAHAHGKGYGKKFADPGLGIKSNTSFMGAIHNAIKDDLPTSRNRRTVWTIATQPTKEAHFATFPEKLVEPCILAGTSERGCCPKCGKPWKRVIEKTGHVNKREDAHVPNNTPSKTDSTGWGPTKRASEIWIPDCICEAGEPVPCIVFDPFVGSGTVERVAIRLRRRSIGIDLNFNYINKIARIRTGELQIRLI